MDLIFVDIKTLDPDLHNAFTGQDNFLILENIKKLNGLEAEVVIRVPVIEGVNASWEVIASIAGFVKEAVNPPKIELLPYHTLGRYKYEKLGIEAPGDEFKTPSSEKMKELEDCVRNEGVQVVRYV
jgi:pyruvate formate lyase activating enzyme